MNAIEKLIAYAGKRGKRLKKEGKKKQKSTKFNSAAKQKELLILIATDLGYLE